MGAGDLLVHLGILDPLGILDHLGTLVHLGDLLVHLGDLLVLLGGLLVCHLDGRHRQDDGHRRLRDELENQTTCCF